MFGGLTEKQWVLNQYAKLDHLEWTILKEETDPLFQDKIGRVLGFLEKNLSAASSHRDTYLKIQKLYEFIGQPKDFKLPNFLNYEKRLN